MSGLSLGRPRSSPIVTRRTRCDDSVEHTVTSSLEVTNSAPTAPLCPPEADASHTVDVEVLLTNTERVSEATQQSGTSGAKKASLRARAEVIRFAPEHQSVSTVSDTTLMESYVSSTTDVPQPPPLRTAHDGPVATNPAPTTAAQHQASLLNLVPEARSASQLTDATSVSRALLFNDSVQSAATTGSQVAQGPATATSQRTAASHNRSRVPAEFSVNRRSGPTGAVRPNTTASAVLVSAPVVHVQTTSPAPPERAGAVRREEAKTVNASELVGATSNGHDAFSASLFRETAAANGAPDTAFASTVENHLARDAHTNALVVARRTAPPPAITNTVLLSQQWLEAYNAETAALLAKPPSTSVSPHTRSTTHVGSHIPLGARHAAAMKPSATSVTSVAQRMVPDALFTGTGHSLYAPISGSSTAEEGLQQPVQRRPMNPHHDAFVALPDGSVYTPARVGTVASPPEGRHVESPVRSASYEDTSEVFDETGRETDSLAGLPRRSCTAPRGASSTSPTSLPTTTGTTVSSLSSTASAISEEEEHAVVTRPPLHSNNDNGCSERVALTTRPRDVHAVLLTEQRATGAQTTAEDVQADQYARMIHANRQRVYQLHQSEVVQEEFVQRRELELVEAHLRRKQLAESVYRRTLEQLKVMPMDRLSQGQRRVGRMTAAATEDTCSALLRVREEQRALAAELELLSRGVEPLAE